MRFPRIIVFVALVAAPLGQPRAETFDRPAAIIGGKIILESEVQAQTQIMALQNKIDLSNAAQRARLRAEVLRQMINDRLILSEAEKDTTISVEPDEVEQALTEHVENLQAQFPDQESFDRQLAREGLTAGELRRRFRQSVSDQLLKQKLISKKLGKISVTNGEVREFFARYADSLPQMPSTVKLAHLVMPITIDTTRIEALRDSLTAIRAQIEQGLDFAEAARKYSADPTAQNGGELGWFGPGDLVVEFETAAKKLESGQLSGVVRTPFGFHLIQVEEKKGDRFRARHVLLQLAPSAADTAAAVRLVDSLLTAVRSGADFCLLVRDFTADNQSRKNCGQLAAYPIDQMYPEFQQAIAGAAVGDYVGPVISEFGVHILHLLDRTEGRPYSLKDDWDATKEMARNEKTNRVVQAWIDELLEITYVEIKQY